MRILVTGGNGYKGHVLVKKLLDHGHEITSFDINWFGNHHESHSNFKFIKGDILDIESVPIKNTDAIIHLASIANDPCGDLNPKLTWETSCLATYKLADAAVRAGVERLIYASSGSVYGLKEEERVTEELSLEPLSEYNKTKMVSERVLESYSDKINVQILRPATVCGLSPRMRLDVSVNMLTMQALTKQKITVFGGNQIRPNIHIDDICDAYDFLLENPEINGIYNAGFENISILDIAKIIQSKIQCEIEVTKSNDPRSYRLDSSKLLSTGFKPKKNVEIAIEEIIEAYASKLIFDTSHCYNLRWMETIFKKKDAA